MLEQLFARRSHRMVDDAHMSGGPKEPWLPLGPVQHGVEEDGKEASGTCHHKHITSTGCVGLRAVCHSTGYGAKKVERAAYGAQTPSPFVRGGRSDTVSRQLSYLGDHVCLFISHPAP